MSQSALLLSGCTHWAKDETKWYDQDIGDTTKRDRGTEFHTYPAAEIAGTPRPRVTNDPDMERMVVHASAWIRDNLTTAEWCLSEVAFALDTVNDKGSVLLVKDREYPDEPGMFCGTADIVASLGNGTLMIADWKTGAGAGAEEQLLSLAAASMDAYPEMDRYWLAKLLVDPVTGVGAEFKWYTRGEVDNHRQKLRKALRIYTEPKDGVHCLAMYCPALAFCPKTYQYLGTALRSVSHPKDLGPNMSGFKFTEKPQSQAEAALVVRNAQAMKRAAEHFIAAAKAYAAKGQRVAADGYVWKDSGNGYRWSKE